MIEQDLSRLKLLLILNEQRQTVLAAKQLRVSQPTVSAMLKKLRTEFDDELFIRNKNQLEPTVKCEQILSQLPEIFERLDKLYIDHSEWKLGNMRGEVRLFLPAPLIDIIAPPLLETLCRSAPNLTIECSVWTSETTLSLENDKYAWGVGYLPVQSTKNLLDKPLYEDRFMFVMRKSHPLLTSYLDEVLNYPICVTIIPGFSEGSRMEMFIKRYRLNKTVSARLSNMNLMFNLLANSDFIGTTSRLYKNHLPDNIRSQALPPEMNPRMFNKTLSFFTSQRNQSDPMSNWLYQEINAIIRGLDGQ